jgi:hypothetical protein
VAGGNEAQRSDRFDLPKNRAFTFIIRIFWQFHAVTALRFVTASHNEKIKVLHHNGIVTIFILIFCLFCLFKNGVK